MSQHALQQEKPSILIDVSPAVHRKAGLGRYAEDLVAALTADPARGQDYGVFYHDANRAEPSPLIQSLPTVATAQSHYRWRLRALLAHLANLSQDRLLKDEGRRMKDENADPASSFFLHPSSFRVFHATEHLLPRFKRVKTVFTLHDLIFKFFPQHHLPRNWMYLQLAIPLFLRRADAVICVSECTRRDAQRIYHVPDHKLRVIYEGVDARFRRVTDPAECRRVQDKLRLPDRFVLALGTVEPRKNLATLFEAYRRYLDARSEGGLDSVDPPAIVVAGRQGWLEADSFRAVHEHRLTGLVQFLGYVDDEDLPALYSLAALFAMPSVYEGFGLPPLEAMACGTPVVCSNASSLPEVTGDAALLAPPRDVGEWATALRRALTDGSLRADLAARGPRQAARFSWAAAAEQTRAVYDGLMLS